MREKIQEVAQEWIVRCGANKAIKKALQDYSSKGSFLREVTERIDEGVVFERAVELVLMEQARQLWMESVE